MASIHSEPPLVTELPPDRRVEIDGVVVPRILAPQTPEELSTILADAGLSGRAVAPIGGGTKLALGNAPTRLDLAVSTLKLDQIHHYEPADMTLSVGAGARFGDVQALLAERGQTLPVESADDSLATIGGLIATAIAGPRRLGSGTLRDLLIGIAVAYPNGTVAKAGGLVVKNVTGFDLMRLHLGALGTLGVIVSANFKVLPLPRTEATLISAPLSLSDALAKANESRRTRLRPIAVEVVSHGDAWVSAIRLEGRDATVDLGVDSLRALGGWADELRAAESKSWWRAYVDRQSLVRGDNDIVVRCGVNPKKTDALAGEIVELLAGRDSSHRDCMISPGLGAMVLRIGSDAIDPAGVKVLQDDLLRVATSVTILKAPAALKSEIDVWGRVPETVSVMRALKAEFDSNNVLNPGRFVDRI